MPSHREPVLAANICNTKFASLCPALPHKIDLQSGAPQINPEFTHPKWSVSKMGCLTPTIRYAVRPLMSNKRAGTHLVPSSPPMPNDSSLVTDLPGEVVRTVYVHKGWEM